MNDWSVAIHGRGRAGTITYTEGQESVGLDWELGGRDVVAIITSPSLQSWESVRRREILGRVAEEVIRTQAPGARAEFMDGDTTVVLREG